MRSPKMLLIAALVGVSALAAAPAASADDSVGPMSTSQCAASAFCVWSGTNYSGSFASTKSASATSTGLVQARSVWNRSSYAARVYSAAGGTGTSICYGPGAMIASTTANAVSFRILSTTTC